MASSKLTRAAVLIATLVVVFAAGLATGWALFGSAPAPLPANTVKYRVRFGGDVITQYLPGVVAVTLYRSRSGVDGVVFNLENGRDWVLNADKLVDYTLSPTGIQRREVLNELYYHYDPYLQGEKQKLHQDWTNEQYLKWVGRLPTEEEWLEVLNELTRGVEHRQMELWIQYSPAACQRFVAERFMTLLGRAPTPAEARFYYRQLLDGGSYAEVEKAIAAQGMRRPSR